MIGLGYVRAEDIIGKCDPHYDLDGINEDARRHSGPGIAESWILRDGLGGSVRDIGKYEAASRHMITEGLKRIR